MKKLKSSVIICTRNRIDDLKACLQSLQRQTQIPEQLIVIDSSDEPLNIHQEFNSFFGATAFPHTDLVYEHTTPGLTYQRNCGIKRVTKDIVYFFDDDVIIHPDYLEQMNAVFAAHPGYGGGMGSITPMHHRTRYDLYKAVRTLFLLQRDYASGKFTWSGMPTHAYGATDFKTVQVLGGCCMAYRRAIFVKHRFDERLTRYGCMEDCDFSWRVSRDAPLFFNPHAQLEHRTSPVARDAIIDSRAMYIKNYSYLFFKNFYPTNKLKVVGYWWSILGLFVQACALRNTHYLKGYIRGLKEYWI